MNGSNVRIWLGIILIIVGGLLVLDNFGFFFFSFRRLIFSWSTIFIIIGIVILAQSKGSFIGYAFLILGLFGLLRHFVPFMFDWTIRDFWPILLLLFGLWLILQRNEKQETSRHSGMKFATDNFSTQEFDYVDETAVFSSNKKMITSKNFRGGKITTFFGGTEINFAHSKLEPGENTLEIITLFGGTEIRVPQDWKVIVNVSSVFGSFEDKRFLDVNNISSSDSILIIKGTVLFGGGEIYN